jgi:hypothetical protein
MDINRIPSIFESENKTESRLIKIETDIFNNMHDGFSVRLYVQRIMPKRIGFSKDISREREREKRDRNSQEL